MNFKQNRFLVLYLAVVVVGAGALSYFLFESKNSLDAVSQEYDDTAKKVHDLRNRKPFPNEKNLKQLTDLQNQYKEEVKTLAADLTKQSLSLKEVTPQIFQDQLREIVSTVEKKAAEREATLPANFYMGFDRYKNSPPSAAAAPALSRQLQSITLVVNKMLQFKVRQIISISRKELPEEAAAAAPAAAAAQKRIVSQYPFDIVFVTDQGNLQQVFNGLLNAEQFYIIRNLEIANSQPKGPLKKEPTQPEAATSSRSRGGSAPAAAPPPATAGTESKLRVIVGQETLTVALRIEQVNFDIPDIK